MSCAGFERAIEELLLDDVGSRRREELLEAARVHAGACPVCRVSDLWVLLDAEPGRRLTDPEPDGDYWADFNERLARRIETQDEGQAPPLWRTGGSIAAAAVLTLLLAWMGLRQVADSGQGAPLVLPPELIHALESGPRESAMSELELLIWDASAWSEGLSSEEETLGSVAAEGSLAREMAALLAPFDGSPAIDRLADELELDPSTELFPDSDGLDATTRRALIDWLDRQPEGVS